MSASPSFPTMTQTSHLTSRSASAAPQPPCWKENCRRQPSVLRPPGPRASPGTLRWPSLSPGTEQQTPGGGGRTPGSRLPRTEAGEGRRAAPLGADCRGSGSRKAAERERAGWRGRAQHQTPNQRKQKSPPRAGRMNCSASKRPRALPLHSREKQTQPRSLPGHPAWDPELLLHLPLCTHRAPGSDRPASLSPVSHKEGALASFPKLWLLKFVKRFSLASCSTAGGSDPRTSTAPSHSFRC